MRRILYCVLLLLLPLSAYGESLEVDLLYSERHRPHVELVKLLSQAVRAEDIRLFPALENGNLREEEKQLAVIRRRQPDLLILVGEDALQAALAMHLQLPMLSLLSISLSPQMQQQLPITGIDLRPEPAQVADALSRLLPAGATILTYYAPQASGDYIAAAKAPFRQQHLQLKADLWPQGDVPTALNRAMKQADAYWMQMEMRSVAPQTLKLLFALARHGKALVGLSAKYVRAGALIAWTPRWDALGEQAATLANRLLAGAKPASVAITHPANMRVDIRTHHGGDE